MISSEKNKIYQNWYEDWFNSKFYLKLYSNRNSEDAKNLINLILENVKLKKGSKVLDICCGAGRHSIEFAKRGFNVTGFDLSDFLISQAIKNKSAVKNKNLKIKFLKKNMRHFRFSSYDLAVNLFSSFGYFESDIENFSVISNTFASLKKGGYFIFDFFNEKYLRNHLTKNTISKIGKYTVTQKRTINHNRINKLIIIKDKETKTEFTESVKLYTFTELKRVFENIGFTILNIFGDYSGKKFNIKNSERLIFIAHR